VVDNGGWHVLLRSRLFWRLFTSYFLVACAVAVALGLFAASRLHASRFESIQRTFYEESRLVYELIKEDLQGKRAEPVRQKLQALAAAIGCRLTIVDSDGGVLADTEAEPATMENHRLRPEIVTAAAQGEGSSIRWSHTLQEKMLYLAYRAPLTLPSPQGGAERGGIGGPPPFRGEGGVRGACFVRLAVPLAQVQKGLHILDEYLLLGVVIAILLSGAICACLARRQAAPIVELADVAQAIAAGDMSRRSFPPGKGESGALGGALGTVAQLLAQAKSEAAKSQDELRSIIGSMTDAVIVTDVQRRIALANQTAANLLDFPAESAVGKPLWEVVREEQVLKAAEQVAASGQRQTFRCGPIRGRYIAVTISPLTLPSPQGGAERGGGGGPPAFRGEGGVRGPLLLVAHDTTETVQYQELRKEFVANVSHELRTPLTFIKGFVETLQDGALRDPVKGPEYLATIEKHVNQLTNLVSDLLEISRLESRIGGPRRQNVKLADLLNKAAEMMQPAARKKEQSLLVDLPVGLPEVIGDPDYLERAVANLLDNAVKYTPEKGTIRLSAKAAATSVAVEVSDNGIGIPVQDLPRIFERFYRVDKSRSREMGGTGLGLAIAKHIAQAHGGTVEVSSEAGKGSTFRIVLPLA